MNEEGKAPYGNMINFFGYFETYVKQYIFSGHFNVYCDMIYEY